MATKKSRRGRPPLQATERRRHILSVRVRDETREQLEKAAKLNGRSLSQEAEAMIERAFDRPDLLPDVLEMAYGRQLAGLLMVMGRALFDAGGQAGFMSQPNAVGIHAWLEDPYGYDEATKALAVIMEAFRPRGEVSVPQRAQSILGAMGGLSLGEGFANGVLSAIQGRPSTDTLAAMAERARPLLGRLADVELEEKLK